MPISRASAKSVSDSPPRTARMNTAMNRAVSTMPITAALALASIAVAPRLGPTVRCFTISTGTGNAPPRISNASSRASSCVKPPVICVDPPGYPRRSRPTGRPAERR